MGHRLTNRFFALAGMHLFVRLLGLSLDLSPFGLGTFLFLSATVISVLGWRWFKKRHWLVLPAITLGWALAHILYFTALACFHPDYWQFWCDRASAVLLSVPLTCIFLASHFYLTGLLLVWPAQRLKAAWVLAEQRKKIVLDNPRHERVVTTVRVFISFILVGTSHEPWTLTYVEEKLEKQALALSPRFAATNYVRGVLEAAPSIIKAVFYETLGRYRTASVRFSDRTGKPNLPQ